MAKKIQEVPLPRENFLAGYKPITPKFAEDDEPAYSSPTPPTPKTEVSEKTLGEYRRVYLASTSRQESKTEKVYISRRHFDYLKAIADNLKSDEESRLTMSGFIWNMIEDHINRHGKTLAELVNRSLRHNPFDRFKD